MMGTKYMWSDTHFILIISSDISSLLFSSDWTVKPASLEEQSTQPFESYSDRKPKFVVYMTSFPLINSRYSMSISRFKRKKRKKKTRQVEKSTTTQRRALSAREEVQLSCRPQHHVCLLDWVLLCNLTMWGSTSEGETDKKNKKRRSHRNTCERKKYTT